MHSRLLTGADLLHSAYLMVDIFFVMSGFVIALNYEERLISGLYLKQFLCRRVIRLWPIWATGVASGALVEIAFDHRLHHDAAVLASAGGSLLFLPLPISPYLFPYNMPGWSIFFEVIVNLAYAAGLRHLSGFRIRALTVLLASTLCILGLRYGGLNGGATWDTILIGLARSSYGFFCGVLLFRMGFHPHPRRAWLLCPALLLVPILSRYVPPADARPFYDLACVMLVSPLTVGLCVAAGGKFRTLSGWLGTISYPLYVIHFPVIMGAFYLWRSFGRALVPSDFFRLTVVAAAIAAAYGLARADSVIRSGLIGSERLTRILQVSEFVSRRAARGRLR